MTDDCAKPTSRVFYDIFFTATDVVDFNSACYVVDGVFLLHRVM